MGVETSRESGLPDNMDLPETRKRIMSSWTSENILSSILNSSQGKKAESTLCLATITKAGILISDYFSSHQQDTKNIRILEVMAGNCVSSSYVYEKLSEFKCTWVATDMITYPTRIQSIPFVECNPVEAVSKFGKLSDILLMISPTPCSSSIDEPDKKDLGYADYYASSDFIEQTKPGENKHIIIVGELGASDGSEGMYNYLMKHINLELVVREMIYEGKDTFGGNIEKELFIFAIHK